MLECRPEPSGHAIIQEPVERQPDNPAEVLAGRRSELLTWRDPREEESGELLVWRVELRREYVLDAYQILEAPRVLEDEIDVESVAAQRIEFGYGRVAQVE